MKESIRGRLARWIAEVSIIGILGTSCTSTPMTHRSIQVPLQKAAIIKNGDAPSTSTYYDSFTTNLHQAAAKGDVTKINECVNKEIPVDIKDSEGDTPLHLAYYFGQEVAIDRLKTCGSNPHILNKYGDTPLDMQKIARAEQIIMAIVNRKDTGEQPDLTFGQRVGQYGPLFSKLKEMDGAVATRAIILQVIRAEDRRDTIFRHNVILLAIKLGIPGSEQSLNGLLFAYGNPLLAEDYWNSGSDALRQGAEQWAARHNFYFIPGNGSSRAGWGRP